MKDDKLWTIFSIYIRLRDIIPCTNGLIRCISSGRLIHWKYADAGHFMGRRHTATKYHEQNVNAQSRNSNRFNSGEQFEQSIAIDKKWGKGTAQKLFYLSRHHKKYYPFEIEALTKHYKEQVRLLKIKHNIE